MQECWIHARTQQFLVCEMCDGLNTLAQILPEFIDGIGTRKTTSHPDNGNIRALSHLWGICINHMTTTYSHLNSEQIFSRFLFSLFAFFHANCSSAYRG